MPKIMTVIGPKPPEGKRCGKKSYKVRYGRAAGWCIASKKRAYRKPCKLMTQQGLSRSKRCIKKGWYKPYEIRGNWQHV